MKLKISLALCALALFLALPAVAQHDGGHSGSGHGGDMHGSSLHDHSEASEHSGSRHGGHGDNDNDADEHGSKHGDHHGQHDIASLLSKNTQLASKLQSLLPPGTNLTQAAAGFKNLGQFVAAVHVSNNLGIPFDQLKAKMTGTSPESLGKAIHDLAPNANVKAALKQAKAQTKQDLDQDDDHDADGHHAGAHDANDMDRHDATKSGTGSK